MDKKTPTPYLDGGPRVVHEVAEGRAFGAQDDRDEVVGHRKLHHRHAACPAAAVALVVVLRLVLGLVPALVLGLMRAVVSSATSHALASE